MRKYVLGATGCFLLILFDIFTKNLAVAYLKGGNIVSVISGVFEFRYLENAGAAFGIFENMQLLFVIISIAILVVVLYIYIRIPQSVRFVPLHFFLVMLAAGAIGNLIDRLANGYVVDFMYFRLIDFPIFNVADCYITVSVIVIIVLLLFKYRDKDYAIIRMSLSGKKNTADE